MSNSYVPLQEIRFPHDLDPEKANSPSKAWVQFRLGSERKDTIIALPTPPNISFNTNIQYNDISLGIIEGAFDMFSETMDKNGGDIFASVKDTALGVWDNTVNSGTAKSGGLSTQVAMASSLFKALKISPISDVLEPFNVLAKQELRNKGVAVNPNTELYFQDVGLRSFNFTFRLAPRNVKDSRAARSIVTAFEYYAHPDSKERLLLEYPDECIITFFEGGEPNDRIPAINRCVIKSFSHTYNAESTWFEDGYPGMIDISITFQEITVNTKRTINRPNSDTERQTFSKRKASDEREGKDINIKKLFGEDSPTKNTEEKGFFEDILDLSRWGF
jgi:hypothetical protein